MMATVNANPRSKVSYIELVALLVILLGNLWWRAHTFAPSLAEGFPLLRSFWPVVRGQTEPLDCDESAYGYMARRLCSGDVLYKDLSENKPPLGYWFYQGAVAMGGPNELAIRLLPIPFIWVTLCLVWWAARRLGGLAAGLLAMLVASLWTTDPCLYGNGAQFEIFLNVLSIAAFAAWLRGLGADRAHWAFLAGLSIGLGALVRQVAIVQWLWLLPAILVSSRKRLRDFGAGVAGTAVAIVCAAGLLIIQGAGAAAYEDVFVAATALATATPSEPNMPPLWMRWLVGNADPRTGALPWPFGQTDYLVWWGEGSWPLWLMAPVTTIYLCVRGGARERILVVSILVTGLEVALPGQYWAHYYALPVPLLSIALALVATRPFVTHPGSDSSKPQRGIVSVASALGVLLAIAITLKIQIASYLLTPAEELTSRYKGGGQWIVLRDVGRELGRRTRDWENPQLYVWGYQSPLLFYSGLSSVTPYFFTNAHLRARVDSPDPLAAARLSRIMRDLEEHRPELVFAGYPPYPALRTWLESNATRTSIELDGQALPIAPRGMGLWVARDKLDLFESSTP
jgi:hypothetical protein